MPTVSTQALSPAIPSPTMWNVFEFISQMKEKLFSHKSIAIMKQKNLLVILFLLFLFSCKNDTTEKQTITLSVDEFRLFLQKFKMVKLPFVYRSVNYEDNFDFKKMQTINILSNDTLFIKENSLNGIKFYGVLSDTSKVFSLIYFCLSDSYYPVLATYDKSGKLIDRMALIVNGCGGGCGVAYCSETGIIDENSVVFCADTLIWDLSSECFSELIPNNDSIWIETKTAQLTKDGKLKKSSIN